MRGVDDQLAEGLLQRLLQPEGTEPRGRDPAGRGLTLADLVAIDDQDVGPAAGQLPGHGQTGEAGPADENVTVALQRCAVGSALGGSLWHGG